MIEFVSFTKKYKDMVAVNDFSCTISANKITGLLGANGAGKTSVLKALAGIHYPTQGQILIDGLCIQENPLELKKSIGYISENPLFYQNIRVRDLLRFIADIHFPQLTPADKSQKIETVIEQTALAEVTSKKIRELSKGFRQRLAFAQALIHQPSILILDEPTSALDPVQIAEIRNLIKHSSTTATVILSSHIMQEIEALCDEVIILHRGSLRAKGTIAQILAQTKQDTLEKAFLSLVEMPHE
ncbi:MAG: ABC transporter ATP-binding protein [Treponemataceae bacterium]